MNEGRKRAMWQFLRAEATDRETRSCCVFRVRDRGSRNRAEDMSLMKGGLAPIRPIAEA